MLKQLIAFLFLIAFATQTFGQAITVAHFYINQNYIAKNLCENREMPQLKCCGKCQLSKKLKQEEKQEQQVPGQKGSNKNEVLSSKSFFSDFTSVVFSSPILFKSHTSFDGRKMPFCIFHPPQV